MRLLVVDQGRPAAAPDPQALHFGLVGMAERARSLGGRFEAGPTADGWRVEAYFPIAAATRDHLALAVIRVLIVDDQPVVRAGVARILGPDDGFEVVAECGDGDEVVAAVELHQPDVVLMDIRMRRVDGVTATRALSAGAPARLPVLVLTTFDDDEVLWDSLDAGAAGFVLKDASADDLIAAAAGGRPRARPGWTRRWRPGCCDAFRANARPRLAEAARVDALTDREHDVLRSMATRGDERRDRRRAARERTDGEDPRRLDLLQARASATGRRRSCSPTTTASSIPGGAERATSTHGRRRGIDSGPRRSAGRKRARSTHDHDHEQVHGRRRSRPPSPSCRSTGS